MRIFRKTAIREASFLQALSTCALKESALSIFRPKSETQSTFAKAWLVPKITNALLDPGRQPLPCDCENFGFGFIKRELIRQGPLLDFPDLSED